MSCPAVDLRSSLIPRAGSAAAQKESNSENYKSELDGLCLRSRPAPVQAQRTRGVLRSVRSIGDESRAASSSQPPRVEVDRGPSGKEASKSGEFLGPINSRRRVGINLGPLQNSWVVHNIRPPARLTFKFHSTNIAVVTPAPGRMWHTLECCAKNSSSRFYSYDLPIPTIVGVLLSSFMRFDAGTWRRSRI